MSVSGSGSYPISGNEGLPVGSVIAGLFAGEQAARQAIDELTRAGFGNGQIYVASIEGREQDELADQTEADLLSKESVVTGSLGGRLVEGAARLLAGGRGAANIVHSTLVRLGFTEEQSRYYESGYESGRILVVVDASIQADEAVRILGANGGDLGPVTTTGAPLRDGRETTVSTSGSTPPSTGPAGLNIDEART